MIWKSKNKYIIILEITRNVSFKAKMWGLLQGKKDISGEILYMNNQDENLYRCTCTYLYVGDFKLYTESERMTEVSFVFANMCIGSCKYKWLTEGGWLFNHS